MIEGKSGDGVEKILGQYIASAIDRPLPPDVVKRTKAHLLDTLAAMVTGAELFAGKKTLEFFATMGGPAEAHVVGSRTVTSAIHAATANGMLAHADETDDHHVGSVTHPGASVVPAAMAVAESRNSSGRDFLAAITLGYDITVRLGLALTDRSFVNGVSLASFGGGFGAGAAAGALLRINGLQAQYMLSYVAQQTAGLRSRNRDPDHIEKAFIMAGAPARNGVTAARMVHAGFTGVDEVFTGEHNFLDFFSPQADRVALVQDLGKRFDVMHTSIKKWCVGGPVQAPLDGLATLMAQGLTAERIARIDVRIATIYAAVVDNRPHPTICLQHILGLVLVDGELTLANLHDVERMNDPRVRHERAKVNLIADPEMDKVVPRRPIDVVVTLTDGTVRECRQAAVLGTIDNPMTPADIEAKAMVILSPVIGREGAEKLRKAVEGIDGLPNIREFAASLGAER